MCTENLNSLKDKFDINSGRARKLNFYMTTDQNSEAAMKIRYKEEEQHKYRKDVQQMLC